METTDSLSALPPPPSSPQTTTPPPTPPPARSRRRTGSGGKRLHWSPRRRRRRRLRQRPGLCPAGPRCPGKPTVRLPAGAHRRRRRGSGGGGGGGGAWQVSAQFSPPPPNPRPGSPPPTKCTAPLLSPGAMQWGSRRPARASPGESSRRRWSQAGGCRAGVEGCGVVEVGLGDSH